MSPEPAIAKLNELVGSRASAVQSSLSPGAAGARRDYVRWVINLEAQLAGVLHRDDARAFFDNPAHRDVLSMPPDDHLLSLVYAEIDANVRDLEEAVTYLRGQLARMRAAPGLPIVLDSNVLLQCQRLDYLGWRSLLGEDARLMLPLRVVEEVDAKKYGESKRLRSIARGLLPWVDGLFPNGEPGPVPVRSDATLELILAERPRYRPSDADEEVLDVAHEVLRFTNRVRVMTADTGMRVRARSEGLDVLFVPQEWRRNED